jgi:hypothetical protein
MLWLGCDLSVPQGSTVVKGFGPQCSTLESAAEAWRGEAQCGVLKPLGVPMEGIVGPWFFSLWLPIW